MRQWAPDRAELPERPGPAVTHDQRDGVFAIGAGVDEVQFDAFDACGVVRVLVDLILNFEPVVV